MLRLIIQTKRKYKNKKELVEKDVRDDEISEDTREDSTHHEYDQDSSIPFDDDEDNTASQEDDLGTGLGAQRGVRRSW